MSDFRSHLSTLKRPSLLIRAARLGLPDYRRDRDLRRLMGTATPPPPQVSVPHLIEAEDRIETSRQEGASAYSATRHVDLLIALMSEAQLLPRNPSQ
jgi:hypothetical protein